MDKKEKIGQLEEVLNGQIALLEQLNSLLDQLDSSRAAYLSLLDYYDSPVFLEDVALSNQGYFDGIPCGILSEDGVYNHIFERRQIAERLRQAADDLAKD